MLKEWAQSIAEAALILLLLFIFLWPASVVGISMEPQLENGDRILISRFSAMSRRYSAGDLVVFEPDDYDKNMVKRVIAVGGDSVKIKDGVIYINDQKIDDAFAKGFTEGDIEIKLDEDEVFLMGDNREESIDSRDFGAVSEEDIYGKVIFRFFPFDKITLFD